MKTKIFILILSVLVLGFLMTLPGRALPRKAIPEEAAHVRIGGTTVAVEVADTPLEQAQGLSGREGLGKGKGLLFVFETPGKHAFWMKDMKFDIDIIWLAPSGDRDSGRAAVVHVKKNASPGSFPETFTPPVQAQYVLEVPAGFADTYGVSPGSEAVFTK